MITDSQAREIRNEVMVEHAEELRGLEKPMRPVLWEIDGAIRMAATRSLDSTSVRRLLRQQLGSCITDDIFARVGAALDRTPEC